MTSNTNKVHRLEEVFQKKNNSPKKKKKKLPKCIRNQLASSYVLRICDEAFFFSGSIF